MAALRDSLAAGAKAVDSSDLDRVKAGAALAVLERIIGRERGNSVYCLAYPR